MKNYLHGFTHNLVSIFSWPNLIWHVLAVGITYLVVVSGFDWYYFQITRPVTFGWTWGPAGLLGGILPILVPLTLYLIGIRRNNLQILNTSFAVGQSVFLGWLISSTYKVFTGRIQPDLLNTATDISRGFRFGIWEGGIFWGWPSSHTTIAFAMATALILLYPRNKKIIIFSSLYAIYIGFGASIGFHWFSEFIAGVIFGVLIGSVVGKSFQAKFATK